MSLKRILREVRACRICEAELPLGPRPVVQLASAARLLIIGQAPGSKVHQSGIPWNDQAAIACVTGWRWTARCSSTKRGLRSFPWGYVILAPQKAEAIVRLARSARRDGIKRLFKHLPDLQMTLLALVNTPIDTIWCAARKASVTETVKAFSQHGPRFFPLPHPSWRSAIWMRKHPWFEAAVIPELRKAVRKVIGGPGA